MIARAAFEWVAGQAPVPVPVPVDGATDPWTIAIFVGVPLFLAFVAWTVRRQRNKARGPENKQLQSTQLTPTGESAPRAFSPIRRMPGGDRTGGRSRQGKP